MFMDWNISVILGHQLEANETWYTKAVFTSVCILRLTHSLGEFRSMGLVATAAINTSINKEKCNSKLSGLELVFAQGSYILLSSLPSIPSFLTNYLW